MARKAPASRHHPPNLLAPVFELNRSGFEVGSVSGSNDRESAARSHTRRTWMGFVGVVVVCAVTATASLARAEDPGPARQPTDTDREQVLPFPLLGGLGATRGVGPPDGSVLAGLSRDGGLSVQLSDGSILWLFGDTIQRTSSGEIRFFVIGTAALAPQESPTETLDYSIGGRPAVLAQPTQAFPSCPPEAPTRGMWPISSVVVPHEAADRVIVWLANVCLGDGGLLVPRGVSVGEWLYKPATQGEPRPIVLTILEQNLFGPDDLDEPLFGAASVVGEGGYVYTLGCRRVGELPADSGRACFAARVDPAEVEIAEEYEVWDGEGFNRDQTAAVPVLMPVGGQSPPIPPGQVSVAWHRYIGKYVMVYSPWPGWSDVLEVRVSEQPWGPWSSPSSVTLPGCDDVLGGRRYHCYTASRQPFMDSPTDLGVGYYDSLIDADRGLGGALLVAPVPLGP